MANHKSVDTHSKQMVQCEAKYDWAATIITCARGYQVIFVFCFFLFFCRFFFPISPGNILDLKNNAISRLFQYWYKPLVLPTNINSSKKRKDKRNIIER